LFNFCQIRTLFRMKTQRRSILYILIPAAAVFIALAAPAQQPHRIAVLVNENSQDSKHAANVFAGLHGVPGVNLIYLDLPAALSGGKAECTPEEFQTLIFDPAQQMIKERGLDKQIVAWVYSVDFPIRILTSANDRQQMSLMGITFMRGRVPAVEMVEKGLFASKLFAGPMQAGEPKNPPRSFDSMKAGLKDEMPLPSMMLGYTGEQGSGMEVVLRCITNGVLARRHGASPKILLNATDDTARSAPREWQFADVKAELAMRANVVVSTNTPAAPQTDLMGVMTGMEHVTPAAFGTFVPGAMAEHLTSWAAQFQKPQTKCTAWLDAGATVTAGTVTEPYNVWLKFPHARFFTHYAAGCTAMESFFQSIFSPVQILLLGDPLSQITGLPVEIKTVGLSKMPIQSSLDAAFVAQAKFPLPISKPLFSAALNGVEIKPVEDNALIDLPFKDMADGYHEVRIIAQAPLPTTPGGYRDIPVYINKKGRAVKISDLADAGGGMIKVRVAPAGEEQPKEIALLWNGRELDRKPYAADIELLFAEKTIGEGPHRIQAVAIYEDGMKVRSEPQGFGIAFNTKSDN